MDSDDNYYSICGTLTELGEAIYLSFSHYTI